MKKDLSIIIVDYKTPKLVKDLVSSIKKNTLKTSYEVIVIDNSVKNVGFSGGVNKGIKKAKGKYVLLLNSDTKVSKGAIDRLFEFAKNNPDAGAVVPQLLNKDGSVQPSVFRLPKFSLSFKKYVPKKSQVDGAVMAAFLITPKALQKVGMLDEKYFMYYEDLDYCKRLKQAGLKIYYDKDVKITHYHGESGKDKASSEDQWRRLIPSSILYHGKFKHYLLYYLTLLNQKFGLFSLLVPLFILPVVWSLLRPGFFPMQDDLQAFRVQQMDKCFDDFQIPCRWVPDAGYKFGYPQFNFYPPLPYYMGALMHRVGIQYIDVVKILFVLGYLLSAYTIYLLVSEFLGKWAGFVTAIAYTYIPYKAVEVYVRGALSEFWAQIFFPLIFWAIYKLIKTGKKSFLLVLSISAACLATTHVLMTMIFAPIAIVWAIYWLYEARWKNLGKIMWSGVLGFGLCAFFILPVMIERKFTHTEGLLSGYFDYRQHFVNLYKLFLSSEWGYGSSGFPNEKLNLSLGIVQWTTGVLALALAYINRNKNKKLFILTSGVFLVTLISVFMIHQKSSFIWAKLPLLWYMQFPWRFLAVCIFLLCLLVGFAVYLAGKYKYILGSLIIVVSIFLNLGFFVPKDWLNITDKEKFSGESWQKQLTISIFDYLPIYGELPPWSEAPELPEVMDGVVTFVNYQKGSNWQRGEVSASVDSTIRIPLFDFPGMVVKIDGQKVKHHNDDCRNERYCRGLITFNVPEGSHQIEAKLTDTPVRRVGNYLTLISIGIVTYIIWKKK